MGNYNNAHAWTKNGRLDMLITKTMFDMIMFDMNNVWRMNQYYSVSRPACGAGPSINVPHIVVESPQHSSSQGNKQQHISSL